jgi:hypothetical protein
LGPHRSIGFTLTASYIVLSGATCRNINPVTHYLAFGALFWSLGGITLGILHVCKISIVWMMPRSAISLSNSQAPLDHNCTGFWVSWGLNLVKHFPRWPCEYRVPWSSLLKVRSFKWVKTFSPRILPWVGSSQILGWPQGFFPIDPAQSSWFLFKGTNL